MTHHTENGKPVVRRRIRPTRIGIVVSSRGEKTAVVAVERRVAHPVYRKLVRRTTRYMVHDERNEASIGDRVRIAEGRPLSRRKRWRLVEILEKGAATVAAASAAGEETV